MKPYSRIAMMCVMLLIPALGYAASSSKASAETETAFVGPVQEMPPADVAGDTSLADMKFPVMRTIGGLGFVVFLMVGLFLAAKKFAPRYFNKPVSQRNLKVLETLGMGDRRSISLIEVGNSRFLVGNTPHQINLLAALPEPVSILSQPEEAPAVSSKAVSKKGAGAPFRNLFEVEKSRPPVQQAAHPLPDDLRLKMRQLRDALERS